MIMRLNAIRALNVATTALLIGSSLAIAASFVVESASPDSPIAAVLFVGGWCGVALVLLLASVIDRVRCPNCGRPFNRPELTNRFARNFARTTPHWHCVHCGFDRHDHAAAERAESRRDASL